MIMSDTFVFIVDDDALIRDSLEQLIKSVGLKPMSFSSARAFLEAELTELSGCLVSDIRMPGLSGLDLQDELAKRNCQIPIIFITGHGTVSMSVRAMKAGAVDFLQKPFEDQELLDAIQNAVDYNQKTRLEQVEITKINQRMQLLTLRENEVLVLIIAGVLNKKIAFKLQMSESTVKTHRARIMRKMEADSFAELIRKTEKAGIIPKSLS